MSIITSRAGNIDFYNDLASLSPSKAAQHTQFMGGVGNYDWASNLAGLMVGVCLQKTGKMKVADFLGFPLLLKY